MTVKCTPASARVVWRNVYRNSLLHVATTNEQLICHQTCENSAPRWRSYCGDFHQAAAPPVSANVTHVVLGNVILTVIGWRSSQHDCVTGYDAHCDCDFDESDDAMYCGFLSAIDWTRVLCTDYWTEYSIICKEIKQNRSLDSLHTKPCYSVPLHHKCSSSMFAQRELWGQLQ